MPDMLEKVTLRCTMVFEYTRNMQISELSIADAALHDQTRFTKLWDNAKPDLDYSECTISVKEHSVNTVPLVAKFIILPLSLREQEVYVQMAAGLTDKEIGVSLKISVNTVKSHVKKILKKTNSSSRTHAISQSRES